MLFVYTILTVYNVQCVQQLAVCDPSCSYRMLQYSRYLLHLHKQNAQGVSIPLKVSCYSHCITISADMYILYIYNKHDNKVLQ